MPVWCFSSAGDGEVASERPQLLLGPWGKGCMSPGSTWVPPSTWVIILIKLSRFNA